jgi:hypothetical protein
MSNCLIQVGDFSIQNVDQRQLLEQQKTMMLLHRAHHGLSQLDLLAAQTASC